MWEGVVRRCDVYHNHPRNMPKGDEKKKKKQVGGGFGLVRRDQTPTHSSSHLLPVFSLWIHSGTFQNLCCSQFLHISPIIVTQMELEQAAVASSCCLILRIQCCH